MELFDAHTHFFSWTFFETLALQAQPDRNPTEVVAPVAAEAGLAVPDHDPAAMHHGDRVLRCVLGDAESGRDAGRLAELERHFGADIADREGAIQRVAGCEFNPRSPAQVKEVLFTTLGLPDNHSGSTRRSALEQIASLHPVIEMLLSYRERHKLLTTYVQPLQARRGDDGRIHPTYDPAGSATGRLACRHPNLQNLPVRTEEGRLIRSAFVAPKGSVFLSADYSQIDLRVLAHLSGDPGLAEVFAAGRDIHTATAAMMTGKEESAITPDERRAAKTINFGIIYGMGPQRLASELSLKLDEAKERIEAYFAQFPRIRQWMDKVVAEGRELGYVTTFEGRRRPLPDLNSANRMLREAAERQAINTPVQGGSADIIKRAMVALAPLQDKNFILLLQVHDELLFEVTNGHLEEARDKAVSAMEGAVEWPTQVVVETKAGVDYAALS
ncbi:hypothetical protein IIA16_01670 [bacterium]|nr:hypothetical protein [bacterium]